MTAVMRVVDEMSNRVISVGAQATVFSAVSKMLKHDVGCIVVVSGKKVVGIVTKGDVLKKAVRRGLDTKTTPVEKIMTRNVLTVGKDALLEEASRSMSEKHVSKLPVLDGDKLVGIVTSTDIIRAEPMQVGYLEELVRARYVPHERT